MDIGRKILGIFERLVFWKNLNVPQRPKKLRTAFSVDLRSLALLRICIGLFTIGDLIQRSTDLVAFYTDAGILPRSKLIEDEMNQGFPWWSMTFHSMSGRWEVQALLMVIAGLFALALTLGYRTRIATFMTWLFTISIQSRNPLVLQGGDVIHRIILFWGLFLPWSEVASLDALYSASQPPQSKSAFQRISFGTVAYLFQATFIYTFAGLLKTGAEWTTENSGLYYALSIEQFATHFGLFLRNIHALAKPLNWCVLRLEMYGPLFLFFPLANGVFRAFVFFSFLFLQLGILSCLKIGHFPLVSVIAYIGVLPPLFWNWIPDRISSRCLKMGRSIGASLSWLTQIFPYTNPQSPAVRRWSHRFSEGLALLLIGHVFLWNMGTISHDPLPLLNETRWISTIPRLDQKWDMFAPFPIKDDGWYLIPGNLRNGQTVDLFRGGAPVTWDKPPLISDTYRNFRWRKYLMNLWLRDNAQYRLYYGRYLCRQWNTSHLDSQTLMTFKIHFMLRRLQPNYREPASNDQVIWDHHCF